MLGVNAFFTSMVYTLCLVVTVNICPHGSLNFFPRITMTK